MALRRFHFTKKQTADAKKLQERQKLMNGRALDQYNKED